MNRKPPTETPNRDECSAALIVGSVNDPLARALTFDLLSKGAAVSFLTDANQHGPMWIDSTPEVTHCAVGVSPEQDRQAYRDVAANASRIFNLGCFPPDTGEDDPFRSLGQLEQQLKLLEACAEASLAPHIVFASSSLLYGAPDGAGPVDEHHPLTPKTMTGVHAIAAENYHRIFGLLGSVSFSICRISYLYGGRVSTAWDGWDLADAVERSMDGADIVIPGDGSQRSDWIHIDDLVCALQIASTHPAARNQVFNIGSGRPISVQRAAEVIRDCTSGTGVRCTPNAEVRDDVISVRKAASLLGFTAGVSFAAGIAAMVSDRQAGALAQPGSMSVK